MVSPSPDGNKFALVTGISEYGHMPRLVAASKDRGNVRSTLRDLGFNLSELAAQDCVLKQDFVNALEELVQKGKLALSAGKNPILVFWHSGHGLQVHEDALPHLVASDSEPDSVDTLVDTNYLITKLNKLRAEKHRKLRVIMVLDCWYGRVQGTMNQCLDSVMKTFQIAALVVFQRRHSYSALKTICSYLEPGWAGAGLDWDHHVIHVDLDIPVFDGATKIGAADPGGRAAQFLIRASRIACIHLPVEESKRRWADWRDRVLYAAIVPLLFAAFPDDMDPGFGGLEDAFPSRQGAGGFGSLEDAFPSRQAQGGFGSVEDAFPSRQANGGGFSGGLEDAFPPRRAGGMQEGPARAPAAGSLEEAFPPRRRPASTGKPPRP
ncbi:unnamed protein product [Symbiodinium sp. KB8]|nr:unnamed protein product [Symbiodinium sp. KB8]